MAPLGLYVHVPFCSAICRYCNFNRGHFDRDLKERYVRAVLSEIRSAPGRIGLPPAPAADTVFFGGGTPSLLAPADIAAILRACAEAFAVSPGAEVTLEANPETVTAASLAAMRDAGVNRLSVGVQSFRDDELRRLGRIHDAARARQSVTDARAAGFDNLSLDLMMWLPAQSIDAWMESVDEAVSHEPEHLSLYILELYPNAPLREDMARAGWSQSPDDDAAEMYEAAMDRLDAAGYRQYEISNVAAPGRESRHNLKYWQDGEWIGFGPGAHSTVAGERWKNVSGTGEWAGRVDAGEATAVERRVLTPVERWQEALITGLRLTDGVGLEAFRASYGVSIDDRFGDAIRRFEDAGAVRRDGGRLRLTRRGMLVANEVLRVFI